MSKPISIACPSCLSEGFTWCDHPLLDQPVADSLQEPRDTKEQLLQVLLAYYRNHFTPPFRVSPRTGKHYGTHVLDASGAEVAEFWTSKGEPSTRELANVGEVGDSHWECQSDLDAATALAALLNADTLVLERAE